MADVLTLVRSQHEEVKRLLEAVASGSGESREEAFCDLRRLLAVHETAEEEVIYPIARTYGDEATQVVEGRTLEEAKAKKVLADLEKEGPSGAGFDALFGQFRTDVLSHAEAEESQLFPIIQRHADAATLDRMAKAFDLAEKAAPTHPHPSAGTSAAAHLVTGPALAIMDRVRDTIKGALGGA